MIKVTTNPLEKLETATALELVDAWNRSERMMGELKFNPTHKDRSEQFDAVIRVREWLLKAMQAKMTDAEFCKVVGA